MTGTSPQLGERHIAASTAAAPDMSLFMVFMLGRLERQPAGVEGDALADQDHLAGAPLGGRRSARSGAAGGRALTDPDDAAEALGGQRLLVLDLHGHALAGHQLAGGGGQVGRVQRVGRLVGQVPGQVGGGGPGLAGGQGAGQAAAAARGRAGVQGQGGQLGRRLGPVGPGLGLLVLVEPVGGQQRPLGHRLDGAGRVGGQGLGQGGGGLAGPRPWRTMAAAARRSTSASTLARSPTPTSRSTVAGSRPRVGRAATSPVLPVKPRASSGAPRRSRAATACSAPGPSSVPANTGTASRSALAVTASALASVTFMELVTSVGAGSGKQLG